MKRRFNDAILALKQNNGATIVTVLVSMFFLLTLTSIMVFMSYTALRIEQTEAAGIRGFYDSEALMDEIKVGMEHTISEAMVEAYQSVFKTSTNTSVSETVLKSLVTVVNPNYQNDPTLPDKIEFVKNTNSIYYYNTQLFVEYLVEAGVKREHIGVGAEDLPIHIGGNGTIRYDENSLTFEGISVTYTDPDTNISTKITSDIVVTPGENFLTSTAQAIDFSNAVEFCLVATEKLEANVSTIFGGGVYAKDFNFNSGGKITVEKTFIAENGITLSHPSGEFNIKSTAEVWAGDITLLGNSSKIEAESDPINGNSSSIYIQNDLSLDGNQSKAIIKGSLLGFGNSTTNPNESSSILLNGLDTQLDLSDTQFLMLAGHSFITASEGNSLMGESISARPNQLAYLAPISILNNANIVSNPLIIDTPQQASDFPDITGLDRNATIVAGKSLNSYGADILTLTYPLAGTGKSAVYYFITFKDTANANQYFRDYFGANSSEITGYLEDYAELSTVGGIPQVAGNYIEEASGAYSLGPQRDIATESAEFVKQSFDNMVKSLSTAATTKTNPFEHLVDTGELGKFINKNSTTEVYEFKNGEDVVALVVNNKDRGDFNQLGVERKYDTVKLVVATGDVTLNQDFSGLILSDKDITISGSADQISSDPDGVSSAFSATYENPITNDETSIGELFTIAGTASIAGTMEQTEVRDITDMVTYANWTKN